MRLFRQAIAPWPRQARARIDNEAIAGLALMTAAVIAVFLANCTPAWLALWHRPLPWQPAPILITPVDWINEALMAVFFFTVGLEIKREARHGYLAHQATRRLPVLAAVAGMVVPAVMYLGITHIFSGRYPNISHGWPIPVATDIAFALGVMALAGRGLPMSLRILLLSIAVVDDLGAVALIALLYSARIAWIWLGLALLVWGLMMGAMIMRRGEAWLYGALAIALWALVARSGVHAAVAGVAGALTVPFVAGKQHHPLLMSMETALLPYCRWGILPLFALANAGVSLHAPGQHGGGASLASAIALALLIGKPLGIFGAISIAGRTGIAPPPEGVRPMHLMGISLLGGTGFSMSLFFTTLTFEHQATLANAARLGLFAGSLASAILGWTVLRCSCQRQHIKASASDK